MAEKSAVGRYDSKAVVGAVQTEFQGETLILHGHVAVSDMMKDDEIVHF